jgi:hypothetical protein
MMSISEEVASMEKHPRVARVRRFVFRPFWQRVYNVTGTDWCGNNSPPLVDKTLLKYNFEDDPKAWDGKAYSVATFVEDGHEIGFGYGDEWKWFIDRKVFSKIVRRYIFIWAWHNWFGLRDWLYFKALHKIVQRRKELL